MLFCTNLSILADGDGGVDNDDDDGGVDAGGVDDDADDDDGNDDVDDDDVDDNEDDTDNDDAKMMIIKMTTMMNLIIHSRSTSFIVFLWMLYNMSVPCHVPIKHYTA